jgi:hypothetical protein
MTFTAADCVAGGGRFYGTLNASYSTTSRDDITITTTDSTDTSKVTTSTTKYGQSQLMLNYDDVLFTKNSLRLACNLTGRQANDAGKWVVRQTYYYDLKSYGYAYSGSYTPYSLTFEQLLPNGMTYKTRLYYREWRNAILLTYNKFPSASITYNLGSIYDDLPTRLQNSRSRNIVTESGYSIGSLSVRANMTQSRSTNKVPNPEASSSFQTYNGTVSFSKDFGKKGYVSSAYSLLSTRLKTQALETRVPIRSTVHSFSGFYNTRSIHGVSGSAGYSGRFTRSRHDDSRAHSSDENFTGQIGYSPAKFLSFDVTKSYQIGILPDGNHISEYLTLSSSVNRFLRRGVDSRFSWSRTYLQQVDVDEDSAANPGGTSTDNFYASLAAQPYPHTRMLTSLSVSRSNGLKESAKQYNVARSLNLVLNASRKLEGRVAATYSYQGQSLSLTKSYTSSVNVGVTYSPESNINMNVSYIQTSVNSTPRLTNSTVASYFGYNFRQMFSIYVSFNRQVQEIPDQTPGAVGGKREVEPRGMNGQLQYRLSPRSSITLNYTQTSGSSLTGPERKTDVLQVIFNGQF